MAVIFLKISLRNEKCYKIELLTKSIRITKLLSDKVSFRTSSITKDMV